MGKLLGLGALFIGGLMLADALTHPGGVQALGAASKGIIATGGNQLIGVSAPASAINASYSGS